MKSPMAMMAQADALLTKFEGVMARAELVISETERAVGASMEMLSQVARTLADVDLRLAEIYVLVEDIKAVNKILNEVALSIGARTENFDELPDITARIADIQASFETLSRVRQD